MGRGGYCRDCPVLSVAEQSEEEEEEEGRKKGGNVEKEEEKGGKGAGLEGDETRSVGLSSQTAHLCELLEAGTEKIRTGGSGFGKFATAFLLKFLTSEVSSLWLLALASPPREHQLSRNLA